jgi:hypothetical protein
MIHAYRIAHYLSWYVQNNPSRKLMLIGHSQGGVLARIVYLISNKSRLDPNILKGKIAPKCWPQNLYDKVNSVISLGAPHTGISQGGYTTACSGSLVDSVLRKTFPDLTPQALSALVEICSLANKDSVNRRFTARWSTTALARTISAGGYDRENVGVVESLLTNSSIPWQSSTALPGLKLGAMGALPVQKHEHEWWMDSGKCVKKLDGFCYYTDAPKTLNPVEKKILRLGSTRAAGDVHDLIVRAMKTAWKY